MNTMMMFPFVETDHPVQDAFRLALVFVPGILILGMTLVVVYKYVRVFLRDRQLSRQQGVHSVWRGLLPIHVAAIAFSYGGLVMMILTSIVERFREPLYSWPRTVWYSLFLWVGVCALYVMTSHQRRRAVAIETVAYPKAFRDGACPAIGEETGKTPPS